uniref:Uncharacterized protein n=1 Tax=Lygus hesperus TaxID=30085 RepID=A0A146LZG2_LYGHE
MESFAPDYPKFVSLDNKKACYRKFREVSNTKVVSTISMLNNMLGLFEQHDQLSNIVVGVRLVISVLNCSVQCFTYTIDEWDSVASGIGLLSDFELRSFY